MIRLNGYLPSAGRAGWRRSSVAILKRSNEAAAREIHG
jgi:hypothetical protein